MLCFENVIHVILSEFQFSANYCIQQSLQTDEVNGNIGMVTKNNKNVHRDWTEIR